MTRYSFTFNCPPLTSLYLPEAAAPRRSVHFLSAWKSCPYQVRTFHCGLSLPLGLLGIHPTQPHCFLRYDPNSNIARNNTEIKKYIPFQRHGMECPKPLISISSSCKHDVTECQARGGEHSWVLWTERGLVPARPWLQLSVSGSTDAPACTCSLTHSQKL